MSSINTATLLGYVDKLMAQKRILDRDHALGLYVVGRPDAELHQLTNAIIAQKLTQQLRIVTIDSVLSIAELRAGGLITPVEAVALLKPSGAVVDDTVRILSRVALLKGSALPAESDTPPPPEVGIATPEAVIAEATASAASPVAGTATMNLITPVTDKPGASARQTIQDLLGSGWYVFGDRTPGRKQLKPGDRIGFYETGVGIVAEARVASHPEKRTIPGVTDPERYPWAFKMSDVRFFFDPPILIDATLRAQLDAFAGRDPQQPWAWFVQATRRVTDHDFDLLTGQAQ